MRSERYPGYNLAVEVGTWALENKFPGVFITHYTDPMDGPLKDLKGTEVFTLFSLIDFMHDRYRDKLLSDNVFLNFTAQLADITNYICYSVIKFIEQFCYAK